jgi:hypothetical protein
MLDMLFFSCSTKLNFKIKFELCRIMNFLNILLFKFLKMLY